MQPGQTWVVNRDIGLLAPADGLRLTGRQQDDRQIGLRSDGGKAKALHLTQSI